MLIYDTRYRSLTIQVFALLAFMLAAAWLVNNTVQNLAALGKTFDFGFLGTRAGYDINQTLISYTNDEHPRPRGHRRHPQHLPRRHPRLHPRHRSWACSSACCASRPTGSSASSPASTSTSSATCPVLLWILAFMAILTDMAPRAHRLPRRERHRAHALRRGRDHQPRLLHPLAGLRARLAARRRRSSPSRVVAVVAFGRYARARQEATGEILPTFWIKLGAPRRPDAPRRPARRRHRSASTSPSCSASTSRAAASSTSR